MKGKSMGGCENGCIFFFEQYGISGLSHEKQAEIEAAIETLDTEGAVDLEGLRGSRQWLCVGGFLEDPDATMESCPNFSQRPGGLSRDQRYSICRGLINEKTRAAEIKWKRISLAVAVAGFIVSTWLGILNYQKPSSEEVKMKIGQLQTQLSERVAEIEEYRVEISGLKDTVRILEEEKDDKN